MQNIFDDNKTLEQETECFTTLLQNETLHIQHIRSRMSKAGEWYDQDHPEWVLLLCGEASLEIEGAILELRSGSYLLIEAHQRHRVLRTSENAQWLAIHLS